MTTNRDRIRCFECRKYDYFARDCPTRQAHMEEEQIQQGKNDSNTFLPLSSKLGGNKKKNNDSIDRNYLTPRQLNYVYKKVELGNLINKNTMKDKIDPDVE